MVRTSLVPQRKNLARVEPSLGQVTSSFAFRMIVFRMDEERSVVGVLLAHKEAFKAVELEN